MKKSKIEMVENLRNAFKDIKFLMILNINKVCVENLRKLRVQLKKEQIHIKVFKNKIVRYAIENTILKVLSDALVGQTALLWDSNINNSLAAARIIYDAKEKISTLEPVCGFLNGKKIDKDYIKYLSKIPNMGILRSKIIFLLTDILKKIIRSIQYQLLMIINTLKHKK